MGRVLGVMGHLLKDVEGEWGEHIPHIQSLVVNKTGYWRGLPDDGIKEFWPDYPALSRDEKRNKVRTEYIRIWEFGSRWNQVLQKLGLDPVRQSEPSPQRSRRYGRGGESPAHRALKEHVRTHPEVVGANSNDTACLEYSLPSLDTVDVLFKSPERWLAVEVKSHVSDGLEQDYERGIYQCIKYRAILMAMRDDPIYSVPSKVDALLVLETRLPRKYAKTASDLGVRVIAGVDVPKPSEP